MVLLLSAVKSTGSWKRTRHAPSFSFGPIKAPTTACELPEYDSSTRSRARQQLLFEPPAIGLECRRNFSISPSGPHGNPSLAHDDRHPKSRDRAIARFSTN